MRLVDTGREGPETQTVSEVTWKQKQDIRETEYKKSDTTEMNNIKKRKDMTLE